MTETDNLLAFATHRYPDWLRAGYFESVTRQYRTVFPGRIEPLITEVLERAYNEAKGKSTDGPSTGEAGAIPPGTT